MDLKEEILKEHSKKQSLAIAKWVGNDKKRFRALMKLFLKGEYRVTQRSAWIIGSCADAHPELIQPYLEKMLHKTQEKNIHVAVKRNVLRILENVTVPEKLTGMSATICFDFLADRKEPIAVRVFAMSVLAQIAKKESGLKEEIRLLVKENMEEEKPAFKARGRKVLAQLEKIK